MKILFWCPATVCNSCHITYQGWGDDVPQCRDTSELYTPELHQHPPNVRVHEDGMQNLLKHRESYLLGHAWDPHICIFNKIRVVLLAVVHGPQFDQHSVAISIEVLKVQNLNQHIHHQNSPGTCQKCKFSGFTPDILNHEL